MENNYNTVEQVRRNFAKTWVLIFVLIALILGISVAIGYYLNDIYSGIMIGVVVTVIVIPVQILMSRISILAMTHGQKADPNEERYRQVISSVEGLSIAAGLKKVPEVYIIPTDVPNAFASGLSEKTAFIGVTDGLIDKLDKQELEGVIAHEISHIVHRDILLSTVTVALVSIILILASILGRIVFFGGRRTSRDDNNNGGSAVILLIIMLAAIIIRPLAFLLTNLIQLSISRKREYAADAYAVRLCGYSKGLANALRKISGVGPYNSEQKTSLGGSQLKCMYIHFPTASASELFSTHPPVEKRIEILENMY